MERGKSTYFGVNDTGTVAKSLRVLNVSVSVAMVVFGTSSGIWMFFGSVAESIKIFGMHEVLYPDV